jgi:hypothetical protein
LAVVLVSRPDEVDNEEPIVGKEIEMLALSTGAIVALAIAIVVLAVVFIVVLQRARRS